MPCDPDLARRGVFGDVIERLLGRPVAGDLGGRHQFSRVLYSGVLVT